MAAPNKQPAGPIPGPKPANSHAPYSSGKPGSKQHSPAPSSPGSTKGIVTKPVGKNTNKLR